MSSIADNINIIRENINEAARATGRSGDEISLVAASKTKTSDEIKQAILAGITAVGENRVQEMESKRAEGAYDGAALHYIGHLQSNKVNKLVGVCDLIETVPSAQILKQIDVRAGQLGIKQDILIEINVGKEPQKAGILPEQTDEIMDECAKTNNINMLGFMAIPPFCEEIERNCYYFDIMFKLFVDIRAKKYDNSSIRLLSMGMSDTYIQAIRCGANMVRVGTAIFGQR